MPSATTQPDTLSPEQVAAYWRDGFLVIDDVLAPDEVAALRAACADDTISAVHRAAGAERQAHHLLALTARHPLFPALARDPRLVARLVPLLGPDIQLQHAKLATKPPLAGAGPYPWHQDFAFFPHTNTALAAVMVMLDDATVDNGCMHMVPGSHRLGLREHRRDGEFTGACQQPNLWAGGSAVPITPRAGGISIHHCLTLHGSPPNRSGRERRGLVFQYRADDAYQLADQVFPDTGLLVAGTRRGRVRLEAGAIALPHHRGRPGCGFGSAWHQAGELAAATDDLPLAATATSAFPGA